MKKIFCLLLSVSVVFSAFGCVNLCASAETAHTQDEAISWVISQVGKPLNYDGALGCQCVDLINYYYSYLGAPIAKVDYAYQFSTSGLPSGCGWSLGQGQPQRGDILIYTGGSTGHVAIYENDYSIYHQNYCGHQYVEHSTFKYNDSAWVGCNYWGYIRPNWKQPAPAYVSPWQGKSCENLGTVFIAFIKSNSSGKYVAVDGNDNVILGEKYAEGSLWRFSRNSDGSYGIGTFRKDKWMDLDGNVGNQKKNVHVWEGNGVDGQQWFVYKNGDGYNLRARVGDYVLDVENGATNVGANIQVFEKNDTIAQKFSIEKISEVNLGDSFFAKIKSVKSNKYFTNDVDNVSIRSKKDDYKQLWHFVRQADGSYKITNCYGSNPMKDLDVYKGIFDEVHANVHTFPNSNQTFKIFQFNSNYYIKPTCTDYFLDCENGSAEEGTNISTFEINFTEAQRFAIEKVDYKANKNPIKDGYIGEISPNLKGNYSIAENGENKQCIFTELLKNSDRDSWLFNKKENGYYTIKNIETGNYLTVKEDKDMAQVISSKESNSDNQLWNIYELYGKIIIQPKISSNRVIDIYAGNVKSGLGVQLYSVNLSEIAQLFVISDATCNHNYDNGKIVLAPTCNEYGLKSYKCTKCGNTIEEKIEKTDKHDFDDGEIIKEATGNEYGIKYYTCKNCQYTKIVKYYDSSVDTEEDVTSNEMIVSEISGSSSISSNNSSVAENSSLESVISNEMVVSEISGSSSISSNNSSIAENSSLESVISNEMVVSEISESNSSVLSNINSTTLSNNSSATENSSSCDHTNLKFIGENGNKKIYQCKVCRELIYFNNTSSDDDSLRANTEVDESLSLKAPSKSKFSVKLKKHKVKLTLKKIKGASKLQYRYKIKGKKWSKAVTVANKKKTYTVKGLKKKKTYLFSIRYKKGKKWSAWSKTRKIKIK